jgi:hypothetical protein
MPEKSCEEEQAAQAPKPVECFDQKFVNDVARRNHDFGLLAETVNAL